MTTEDVGVIHLVRDPRDVLTSRHAGHGSEAYVTIEHWMSSIAAAEYLQPFAKRWLTLRYEDVLQDPTSAQEQILEAFHLSLRPGIGSFSELADNADRLSLSVEMANALNGLRNFDASSIGRWKNNPRDTARIQEVMASSAAPALSRFMHAHGYI